MSLMSARALARPGRLASVLSRFSPPALPWLLAALGAIQPSGAAPTASRAPAPAPTKPAAQAKALDKAVRCAVPSGEIIPADQILRALSEGKTVSLRGRIIEGNLDADQVWPPSDERVMTMRLVTGSLRLESCRLAGRFSFRRCVFLHGLELACTEIRGDLDLSGSDLPALHAPRMRLVGEARFPGVSVAGDVSLPDALVEGGVDLTGARVHGALLLQGTEVRNDLDLTKAAVGSLDFSTCRITGQARLQDILVVSTLSARASTFGRGLAIESARVAGRADLNDARGAGGVSLSNVSAGEDLLLALGSDTSLTLLNTDVAHDLSLFEGQIGSFMADHLLVRGASELEGARFSGRVLLRDCDFGQEFTAQEALFDGDCEFRKVRFPGDDPMAGALFSHPPVLIDTTLPYPPNVRSDEEDEEEGLELQDGPLDPG